MQTRARLSACRRYRFALWRRWAEGPQVLFVMLNPSTADETRDDPTIRRCLGFARSWGFGALAVGNLFAFRTPSPAALRLALEPVGENNDDWLLLLRAESELAVAAWGDQGRFLGRGAAIRTSLPMLHVLGTTRLGEPRHPLYLPARTEPVRWVGREVDAGSRPIVSRAGRVSARVSPASCGEANSHVRRPGALSH
jgi:hypothetical protein